MSASLRALSAETDPAKKSMEDLSAQMSALGLNTGAAASALTFLTNPLTLVGAAVLGVALALRSAASAMADHAVAVRALAAVSGVSVKETSALADTFTLLGLRSEALTVGLFRMGQRIDAGGVGLTRLGISVKDAAGNLKTEGDLFLEVRDRISDIGEASSRSALLIEIFGRGGRELAPAFALSREEFKKWFAEAEKVRPWSEESQRAGIAYTQALSKLSLEFEALKEKIGAHFLPVAVTALSWFDYLIEGAIRLGHAIRGIPDIGVGIGGALRGRLGIGGVDYSGAALGEPGSVGTVPVPRGFRVRSATDIKALELQASAELDAVMRQQERQAGFRGVFEAAGPMVQTPREQAQAELAALAVREQAERAFYATMKVLIAEKEDYASNAVKEMEAKETAAYAAIEKARLGLDAKLVAIQKKESDELTAAKIKLEEEQEARDQKAAEFVRTEEHKLASERIALYGDVREKFVVAEDDKARAAEQAILKEANDSKTAAGLIQEVYRLRDKKIQDYDDERQFKAFETVKSWEDVVEEMGGRLTSKQKEAFDKQRAEILSYYAFQRAQAESALAERLAGIKEEEAALARVIAERQALPGGMPTAFGGPTPGEIPGPAPAGGLSPEGQKFLDQTWQAIRLRDIEKQQTEDLTSQQERLAGEQARVAQKALDSRLKDLEDVNRAEERSSAAAMAIRQEQIRAEQTFWQARKTFSDNYLDGFVGKTAGTTQAIAVKFASMGEFMILELEKDRLAAGDFWDHLATGAKETMGAIRTSLADNFFTFFKTGTLEAGKLFSSLLDGMLKAIANFLAAQVVQAFLNFALSGIKSFGSALGASSGVFFGAEGGVVPGAGGKDTVPAMLTPGELVLNPETAKTFLSVLRTAAAPTGTLAPGAEALLGSSKLASAFPAISNIPFNFVAGGFKGVLFGVSAVQAAQATAGSVAAAGIGGTTGTVAGSVGTGTAAAGQGTSGLLGAGGGATTATGVLTAAGAVIGAITAKEDWQKGVHSAAAALALLGLIPGLQALLVAAIVIELGMMIAGLFGGGPTPWQTFGGRLGQTVQLESAAAGQLGASIQSADSSAALAEAVAKFKATVGTRVGGFGAGSGPLDIPSLPGAGGSKHEGGIVANFDPTVGRLREALGNRMDFFAARDRFGAIGGAFLPALASTPGFRLGGFVPGVGAGDIMPALLEPGEFVVPRAAAAAHAADLEAMRAGRGAAGAWAGTGPVSVNLTVSMLDPSQLGPSVRRRLAEELARDIDDALRRRQLRVYAPGVVTRG